MQRQSIYKKIKDIQSKASEIASEMPWGDILIAIAPLAAEIAADVVVNVSCACVARFGCASTGTPIKSLNGAAKNNAILARFGGGSLAKKGMGIIRCGVRRLGLVWRRLKLGQGQRWS